MIRKQVTRVGGILAACAGLLVAGAASAQASPLAAETGGRAARYVDAATTPGSDDACTIAFSVVLAGTLAVVKDGYQVALDRQVDVHNPSSYKIGMGGPGKSTFGGGGLKDVTGQMQNGVLTIATPPADFDIELVLSANASASGLIHRHCYGPKTRLVYVVDNPATGVKGGDWLWFKGKGG